MVYKTRPDDLCIPAVKLMWERTPLSAREIGLIVGTSRHVIVGLAYRRGWRSFTRGAPAPGKNKKPPVTLDQRLDALQAAMDAAMAEFGPRPAHSRRNASTDNFSVIPSPTTLAR
jgi:hypothetical protein